MKHSKIQKSGFLISAVTFVLMGLIFIIIGIKFEEQVLKIMGYFWLPAGLIQFIILILCFMRKKN
jgi:NhaP-type Na+/H+ or K+/H+ antiporter